METDKKEPFARYRMHKWLGLMISGLALSLFNIIFVLVFCVSTVFAQQAFIGKIENPIPEKPNMDIVLFMFGMDNPVKVGEVDEKGNLLIRFPDELPNSLSADTKEMFASSIPNAFYFSCGNPIDYPEKVREATVYKGGFFSLSHKDQPWEGTLFPVTDKELISWWEDRYYKNPVISSFFEVLYSEQEIDLNMMCKDKVLIHAEGNEIDVEYHYALQLRRGFNIIEYKIEAIQESGLPDIPSIPVIVAITNTKDTDVIQWYAKYYY